MVEFLSRWKVEEGADRATAVRCAAKVLEAELVATFSLSASGCVFAWNAYFALSVDEELVLLTSMTSKHGRHLHDGSEIAVCIYRRPAVWGVPIAGVQALGRVSRVKEEGLEQGYRQRFAQYAEWRDGGGCLESSFVSVRLDQLKVVDEEVLGEERFVEFWRK